MGGTVLAFLIFIGLTVYSFMPKNINSYALAIEAQAKYYLPQMFEQNHYQILTTPVELLESLVKLYEKIKHQK